MSSPLNDDPIITQFRPVGSQWELNDENIQHVDAVTGETILHNYCRHIHSTPLAVFKYLIETKGCNIGLLDKQRNTPFHYAVINFESGSNVALLTYLLSQESLNADIQGQYGWTLLHVACLKINSLPLEIFKHLIEINHCDANLRDSLNNAPIHQAVHKFDPNRGDIAILTYLLGQNCIHANFKGPFNRTLLHIACDNINTLPLEIFKYLIEIKGDDINTRDDIDNSPLRYALDEFDPSQGGNNNVAVLAYLFSQKTVNANSKGRNDCNLLHWACFNINLLPLDIFKLLIETKSADINSLDNKNHTPLHYALQSFDTADAGCDVSILNYLLNQKGLDINIKNHCGHILLHTACSRSPFGVFDANSRTEAEKDTVRSQIVEHIIELWIQQNSPNSYS
jgi:ankyrin repeat protein